MWLLIGRRARDVLDEGGCGPADGGARVRRWFARRAAARRETALRAMIEPVIESCHLAGAFNFTGDAITGWAENTIEPQDRDLLVAVIRDREVIGSAGVGEKAAGAGWCFSNNVFFFFFCCLARLGLACSLPARQELHSYA